MIYAGIIASVLVILAIVMYAIGKSEYGADTQYVDAKEKEFGLYSFASIGYGVMRILPCLRRVRNERAFAIYRSKYDDEKEIDAHNRFFMANQITISVLIPLLGDLLIMLAYKIGKANDVTAIATVTIGITGGLLYNSVMSMQKKEKERIEKVVDDLPNLINRIVILLHSGMPMSRVLCSLGEMNDDTPLALEMERVSNDIKNTGDAVYAMTRMQRRCPCYEISRLFTIIEISVNKGAAGSCERLTELSLELWESKRNNIKKKSANLSTKLFIPTMFLFGIAMVIVVVPLFHNMKF